MVILQQNESESSFLIGMSIEEYVSQFKPLFFNEEKNLLVNENELINKYKNNVTDDNKRNIYSLYKCHKVFEVYAVIKKDLSDGYLVPAYFPELGQWGAYYPFRNYKYGRFISSLHELRDLDFDCLKIEFIYDESFLCLINYDLSEKNNNEVVTIKDSNQNERYVVSINCNATKEIISKLTCNAIEQANEAGFEYVTIRPLNADSYIAKQIFDLFIIADYKNLTNVQIISDNRDILHEYKLSYFRTEYFKEELESVKKFLKAVSQSTSIYLETKEGRLPSFKMINYSGEVIFTSNNRKLTIIKTVIPCFKDIDLILKVLEHQGYVLYAEGDKIDDAYTTTVFIIESKLI